MNHSQMTAAENRFSVMCSICVPFCAHSHVSSRPCRACRHITPATLIAAIRDQEGKRATKVTPRFVSHIFTRRVPLFVPRALVLQIARIYRRLDALVVVRSAIYYPVDSYSRHFYQITVPARVKRNT